MRLAVFVSAALVAGASVLGCRAIVGIDDLTLVDAGHDGGVADGAAADTGVSDGPAVDTGMPDAAGGDAATCGSKTNRGDCEMCCGMEQMQGFTAFQMYADQPSGCVCSACANCSSMKICSGTTSAMMSMCLGCIINTMIDSTCSGQNDPQAKCTGDSTCRQYQACVATCKPLP